MFNTSKNDVEFEKLRIRNLKFLTNQELEKSKEFMYEQKNLLRLIHEQQKRLNEYRRLNGNGFAAPLFQFMLFFEYSGLSPFILFYFCKLRSELLKTKLQKESLENEIGLLDYELKLKNKESFSATTTAMNNSHQRYRSLSLLLPSTNKMPCSNGSGGNTDEVLKLMNERDMLKHQLYFDRSYKEVEMKEIENGLAKTREELAREQRLSRDKVARLENVLSIFV